MLGESAPELVGKVVTELQEELVEQAKVEAADFYKRDLEPVMPDLQWMRDWRPDRGT